MSCPICVETFTKTKRTCVKCPKCEFGACRVCFQEYLTTSEKPEEPKCMSCNAELSMEFISSVTTDAFHNKLFRELRARVELSRERSLLPTTQKFAERFKQANELETKVMCLREERTYLKNRSAEITKELENLYYNIRRLRTIDDTDMKNEKRTFVRRCPNEGCLGYLSSAWKCGLCEKYACNKCHAVKAQRNDPAHTCDPNDVATAELLAKDTKGCPKCGIMIHKIDGCNQMWCPSCHTAFSWDTLKIETGVIHNPHYYEYLRQANNGNVPRQPRDNPCGINEDELPDPHMFVLYSKQTVRRLRLANHIRWAEMEELRNRINNMPNARILTRISYLLGKINDAEFLSKIKKEQKQNEKFTDIINILDTFIRVSAMLFNRCLVNRNDDDLVVEFDELVNLINTDLGRIRNRYKTNVLHISLSTFSTRWIS